MKRHEYKTVPIAKCELLERNPQYLTPKQMEALKRSIERDGFTVPILVRPRKSGTYEIVSGNHRFMAAKALGYTSIPAVVAKLTTDECRRLAINLNLIHGDPQAEQLAPFLADCSDDVLRDLHLPDVLLRDVEAFDTELAKTLAALETPKQLDQASKTHEQRTCKCKTCGRVHVRASSTSSSDAPTNTNAQKKSSTRASTRRLSVAS